MLITLLIKFGMINSRTTDTEYWGDYVTEIRYYEFWDEWISRTCESTSTDADGNTTTTTYDCSYQEDHPEHWTQVFSSGDEQDISKAEYNRLKKSWNSKNVFVDMHRDYDDHDGDMYSYAYDGNILASKTITSEHTYTNKVLNSYSIFNFSEISKEEAKEKGLYDYPDLTSNNDGGGSFFSSNSIDQNPFIGYKPTKNEMKEWKYINGYYGPKNQIRVFLLFYYNKPLSIVKEQQSYWFGGNMNEMIFCFGLDSVTKQIQWVDAFSWCDKPAMEVNFRSFYTNKKKLNLSELADWTQNAIPKYWVRKSFKKDFDYIDVSLTDKQMLWLFIIVMIINIGISVYVVLNDIQYNDDGSIDDGSYNNWNRRRY